MNVTWNGRIVILLGLATLGTGLTGCAPAAAPQSGPFFEELEELKKVQVTLSRQVERTQDNLLLLEAQVRDQKLLLEQILASKPTQMVTGQRQMPAIQEPAPPKPVAAPVARPTDLSPTDIYLQAFAEYAATNYSSAIRGFNSFLRFYPENAYAGNAQFWLAECYYAQQQFDRAAQEFRRVVELHPDSSKAPDALLKLARSLQQQGQHEQAASTLQLLQSRYPESGAAQKTRSGD